MWLADGPVSGEGWGRGLGSGGVQMAPSAAITGGVAALGGGIHVAPLSDCNRGRDKYSAPERSRRPTDAHLATKEGPFSGLRRPPSASCPVPVPVPGPSCPVPSRPVSSRLVPSQPRPVLSRPVPSRPRPVQSYPVSSRPSPVPCPVPSRPVPSRPVPSRPVPSRPVPVSSRPSPVLSCPVPSRPSPVQSRPVPSLPVNPFGRRSQNLSYRSDGTPRPPRSDDVKFPTGDPSSIAGAPYVPVAAAVFRDTTPRVVQHGLHAGKWPATGMRI